MLYLIHFYFISRFDPPDINVNLCNAFEEKISIQLFSSDCNSESEEENYYEWETVSFVVNILYKYFKFNLLDI